MKIKLLLNIWNYILIILGIIFLLGHIFSPAENSLPIQPIEIIAMIFFPIGTLIGLIIFTKKQFLGSIFTIVSLLIFISLIIIPRSSYRMIFTLFIISGPSIIYLILYIINRGH